MAEVASAESAEKLCLSNYNKKRYGSMAKENSMRREKYIKHVVQPGDTLQGLALRYGVSMEQIKRANKMWTTDSLFLRSTLDIPVLAEPFTVSVSLSQSTPNSPVKDNGSVKNTLGYSIDETHQLSAAAVNDTEDSVLSKEEESAADFLIRIDSRIAQTKDNFLKLQKKVVYSEDDLHNSRVGLPQMGYQYHKNNLTGSSSMNDLTSDISVMSQPVVMTRGRKVKSSLKKLEKQQDEIFEL